MSTKPALSLEPTTWEDLRSETVDQGGISVCTMLVLRNILGKGRLGTHVNSAISRGLRSVGLGHLPTELPNREYHEVLLYQIGTPAGDIVEAVAAVTPQSGAGPAAKALRQVNGDRESAKLDAIRAILDGE